MAGLKTRAPLQTRVGTATGLVVVGESGDAQERGIVGEAPILPRRNCRECTLTCSNNCCRNAVLHR